MDYSRWEKGLIPKDKECGVLASMFSMRELSVTLKIILLDLARVNTCRSRKKYFDEEATTVVNGNSNETVLNILPFLYYFKYSASIGRYQNYNQMWLHFEDCMDYMKVLYLTYDIYALFDYSSGHREALKM